MSDEPEWLRIGLAASLNKQYAEDQRALLDTLVRLLQSLLPQEARIEMRGGWFQKKTVGKIVVTLDGFRYELGDEGSGPLRATRGKLVRGVVLKTEEVAVQEWLAALSQALEARAQTSEAACEALQRLVRQ